MFNCFVCIVIKLSFQRTRSNGKLSFKYWTLMINFLKFIPFYLKGQYVWGNYGLYLLVCWIVKTTSATTTEGQTRFYFIHFGDTHCWCIVAGSGLRWRHGYLCVLLWRLNCLCTGTTVVSVNLPVYMCDDQGLVWGRREYTGARNQDSGKVTKFIDIFLELILLKLIWNCSSSLRNYSKSKYQLNC